MTRDSSGHIGCVPRVCGGDPVCRSLNVAEVLVFPVYAGVILRTWAGVLLMVGVPRVCGGDPHQG